MGIVCEAISNLGKVPFVVALTGVAFLLLLTASNSDNDECGLVVVLPFLWILTFVLVLC